MTREVNKFAVSWSDRKNLYDWDNWLDGSIWELERGKDFKISSKNFQSSIHIVARRKGVQVRTSMDGNFFYLQALKGPKTVRSRVCIYDWDKWLDGSIWKLKKGVDFKSSPHSFVSAVYRVVKTRGFKIRTGIKGDFVYFQRLDCPAKRNSTSKKTVSQFPRELRQNYPWDKWLDGSLWELEKGKDFISTLLSFQNSSHKIAKLKGCRVKTRIEGNFIHIQAI